MKRLSIATLYYLIASLSSAQISIGGGVGVEAEESAVPSSWIQASASFYTFPTVSLSAFLDTAGRFAWEYDGTEAQSPSRFSGSASTEASVSYRMGDLSIRGTVDGYLELTSDEDPPLFQLGNRLVLTYGTFDYAVFLAPEYVFFAYDDTASEVAGELGASLTVAETIVVTTVVDAYHEWESTDVRDHGYGVSLESNWYPGVPLSARSDVRVGANRSTDVTEFDGENLYLDNYTQIDVGLSVSASVGRSLNADVTVPVRIRLKDHRAIIAGQLATGNEWRVRVYPALENTFRLTSALSLEIGISTQYRRSNSTYGSLNSDEFGASATFRYRF